MVRCFPIEAFRFHGLLSIYDFILYVNNIYRLIRKFFLVFLNDYKKKMKTKNINKYIGQNM